MEIKEETMAKFKVGDRVQCIKRSDYYSFEMEIGVIYKVLDIGRDEIKVLAIGTGGIWYESENFELVEEATMSKYQELKERIKNVRGWDKEADDILVNLLKGTTYTFVVFNHYDNSGSFDIYDANRQKNYSYNCGNSLVAFSFHNDQCEKLQAFKSALFWLLDHSNIKKDDRQEEIQKLKDEVARIEKQIVDVEMIKKRIKDLEIE